MPVPRTVRRLIASAALLLVASCDRSQALPPGDGVAKEPTITAVKNQIAETDWPCWRGPEGQGVARGGRLPEAWPKGELRVVWEATVANGWSSPVCAGGRVVVTDRQEDRERVVTLDAATGKVLWTRENPVDFDPHPVGRRHGNGPKSTPVLEGDRVYSLGIAGWLQCLDARDGSVVWQVTLPDQFGGHRLLRGGRAMVVGEEHVFVPVSDGQGAPVPLFGYTGSLRLVGELLICPVGGVRGGTIVAFDKRSGKPVWKALSDNVSYSSPIDVEILGQRQVVVMTGPRVVGLDLADGRLLWGYPFQIQYDESISTPVVAGNLVVVGATGRPLTALRVERQGDEWSCKRAWENFDLCSYLSSLVVHGEHLYGMNDGGEFCCVRVADGQTLWSGGSHGYYCTPLLAGERLLGLNERGSLLVLAAHPKEFLELGRSQLCQAATWTTPALVGAQLIVRGDRVVRCLSALEP